MMKYQLIRKGAADPPRALSKAGKGIFFQLAIL
jgi:hypothetical protein